MSGLLLMVAVGMTSCVMTCNRPIAGDEIVELRKHQGFESIEISGSPNVVYTQTDTFGVRLEGPEKMVENMMTEVKDRTLFVYNKGRVDLKVGFINLNWGDKDDVTIYVSSPDLIGVRLNGSGDFVSKNQLDTDEMNIVLRGLVTSALRISSVMRVPRNWWARAMSVSTISMRRNQRLYW